MFSQFTFILNGNPLPQFLGYVSIVLGALLWWYVLTWAIDKVRNRFNVRGIWIINRIIGIVVMVVSGVMMAYTIGLIAMLRKIIPIIPE
jgi:small neutral amino acid transporter SnatA (MarC family)